MEQKMGRENSNLVLRIPIIVDFLKMMSFMVKDN